MAIGCLIVSHNNKFNYSVLEKMGFYFNDKIDIAKIIDKYDDLNLNLRKLC